MMTAVHGIIAAGTVAYLTREASWEKVAMTANHLFYFVGIASLASAVEIPYSCFATKAVFMLTPIFLIEHFRQGQVSTATARSFGYYFNRFYYAAAVVSTVVLVALGHTAYGVGFFAVMALDMLSRSKRVHEYAKTAFEWSAGAAALITFASCAVKLETPRGLYIMGVVAAAVFLPRICKFVQDVLSTSGGSSSLPRDDSDDDDVLLEKKGFRFWDDPLAMRLTRHAMYPVGFLPAVASAGSIPAAAGGFFGGLGNLTGDWRHGL